MRTAIVSLAIVLGLALAATDADARRFGGGGNLGRQRSIPTLREAPKPAPATPPASATPAQANPAPGTTPAQAAPAMPAAKPSFMSRWGGLLAGLGIGALLASLFGAQLAPFMGLLLAGVAVVVVLALIFRAFAGRPGGEQPRPRFAGIASGVPGGEATRFDSTAPTPANAGNAPYAVAPSFEVEPFLRVAKTSFIRLQAANDAADLEDIRDYTTPEMYAEIAMQMQDRQGAPQKTEVVSLDAKLVDTAFEGDYEIASVRFSGLIRESMDSAAEPFDEIWHVRKKADDRRAPWLIAGIQQAA